MRLPVGFAYDGADRAVLDPDQEVQQALRVFFETFRRVGSGAVHADVPEAVSGQRGPLFHF